jgi:glucosamine--fructose-6-phosphate aminotransferase (isomerizing)
VSSGEIAVVHNGIIENFEALRERLVQQGYRFVTQTDTEVIAASSTRITGRSAGGVRLTVREFKGRMPSPRFRPRNRAHRRRKSEPTSRRHR